MKTLIRLFLALCLLVMALPLAATSAQDGGEITLVPFTDETFGLQGVIPDGWTKAGPGIYARGSGALDVTSLIIQAAPGMTAEALGAVLAGQLQIGSLPEDPATLETEAFTWTVYHIDFEQGGLSLGIDVALAGTEDAAYVVLLQSSANEYEALAEAVFTPALQALAPYTPDATEAEAEALPYVTEEVTFENTADASGEPITLAGTLSLPEGDGPFPAVILISGSGAQDRDESLLPIAEIKPFALIADYLTRQGIAVLRYDDRGVGGSGGDPTTANSADLATDAEAALDYLLTRPEIDPAKIGLLGHSEGGLIAPMIAARRADVAFIVSLAGPAVNGLDLLIRQNERLMAASGATQEQIDTQVANVQEWALLTAAEDWEGLEASMIEDAIAQIEALPEEQRAGITDPAAYAADLAAQQMPQFQNWLRYFFAYDPRGDWEQLSVPALALFGDNDVQVDADQNATALQTIVDEAGLEDVTIVRFPTANHLFQDAITGGVEEYGTLPQEFIPDLLPTISEWILTRFG